VFWKRKTKQPEGAAQTALDKLLEQRLNRSLKGHQARDLRVTLEQLEYLERSVGEAHVIVTGSEQITVVPTTDDRSIPTSRASELVNA
jgi:flagellar biosynthesis/type III secretory pathway protein FliH